MPQMAPLSWLMLFMAFSLTLILFSMMNYYVAQPTPTNMSSTWSSTSIKALSWSW